MKNLLLSRQYLDQKNVNLSNQHYIIGQKSK